MKIVLLIVGRTVESYFIQGIEEYSKRLAHYVPFEIAVIPELRNTKSLSTEQQKEREADFTSSANRTPNPATTLSCSMNMEKNLPPRSSPPIWKRKCQTLPNA